MNNLNFSRISKKYLSFFLAISIAAGCGLSSIVLAAEVTSEAEKVKENFNPHIQITEPMKDGSALVDKMLEEAERLNDYSLNFETRTFKKDATVIEAGNLYFKKPKLMRLEETGPFNKGSVAVLGKDGKAHAHGGGLTSFINVTLNPDDHMLDAANGDRMEDSDFLSLAKILKERLKQGQAARVSEKPIVVAGFSEPAHILEIYHPNEPKQILKRVWVHPTTNLPLRWDDYDYKNPCLSVWRNVKTNTGLSDDLFKL